MRFIKGLLVVLSFGLLVMAGAHAADAAPRARPGTVSGALAGAVRMPSLPNLPNVGTGNANMTGPSVGLPTPGIGGINYCMSPNFNRERCCALPNPPANVDCGIGGNIDYCVAPNIDVEKCCIQNPTHSMCVVTPPPPTDYCVAPNIDVEKCCEQNPSHSMCEIVPPDECDINIPLLGTDICTARRACSGIIADGFGGILDEETLACNIPVVAHNWGGVIKKDGQPVMTYVPMGSLMRCDQKLFEQVSNLRRSSQWVVPTMVVGGAGLGAGIGGIIDSVDNKRAEQLAMTDPVYECMQEQKKSRAECTAIVSAGTSTASSSSVVTWNGAQYDLSNPARRAALISALGLNADGGNIQELIIANQALANACATQMFREMVTPRISGDGTDKFGRIKITSGDRDCLDDRESTDDLVYCQRDVSGYSGEGSCPASVASGGFYGNPAFPATGRCYMRDGRGPVSSAGRGDRTASYDWYRANLLDEYAKLFSGTELADGWASCDKNEIALDGARRGVDKLDYVVIRCTKAFGEIIGAATGGCSEDGVNNSQEKLEQAYGAINVLKQLGDPSVNTELLNRFLAQIQTNMTMNGHIVSGIRGEDVVEQFGSGRKFMQTATGRGLVIGTGVGSAAGLGYWFAEGASVTCNVGGLDSVKLNRSYSIKSFRDYIIERGYVK